MIKLLKAMFSSFSSEPQLRSLESLGELQVNDYIRLNDSFALPDELRGKTFQVVGIDSYYYGETLNTEWTLKGDTKKKLYLSISDLGDEDQIVLSYQLKRKEVDAVFGWAEVKAQYDCNQSSDLVCKDTRAFPGWLAESYYRRECAGEGDYFSSDCRGRAKPSGGEPLTYYEFYSDDERFAMDVEMWSADEVDVFISILRPETDIHEFWAG